MASGRLSATAVAALRKSQVLSATPIPSSARAQRATRSGGHPIANTAGAASAVSVDPSEGFMTSQGTPRDSSAPGESLGGKRGLEEVWERCGSVYAHAGRA